MIGWILAGCLASSAALAGPAEVNQARAIFNVGAQAFEKGDFAAALEAFEAAYKLAPRPGILFSMAQAHRRQYHVTHEDSHLRDAVRQYREYLEKVPVGERRADAAQALVELEPVAARLTPGADEGTEARPAATRTRLMVSSNAEGATVTLDGGKVQGSPLISEVAPGKHRVLVDAPGYVSDERELVAVEGGLVAVDVSLRERPARLSFRGPSDADISVDRRLVGRTPLAAPLEVPAGRHVLWISRAGYEPQRVAIEVGRGQQREVPFDLAPNGQRVASRVLLVSSGVALLAGGVFTGLAIWKDQHASDILHDRKTQNLSPARVDDYDSARDARDTFRIAAIASFGTALGLAATSGALYLLDRPVAPPPEMDTGRTPGPREPATRPSDSKSLDLSLAPAWAPGLFAVSTRGSF